MSFKLILTETILAPTKKKREKLFNHHGVQKLLCYCKGIQKSDISNASPLLKKRDNELKKKKKVCTVCVSLRLQVCLCPGMGHSSPILQQICGTDGIKLRGLC